MQHDRKLSLLKTSLTTIFQIGIFLALYNCSPENRFRDAQTISLDPKVEYCSNSEAWNYRPLQESEDQEGATEYCLFFACSREDHEGYSKYLEFKKFLENRNGKIEVVNTSQFCGRKIYEDVATQLEIRKEVTPLDQIRFHFFIDNSFSMNREIKEVRKGLTSLASLFTNYPGTIELNFYQLSDIGKRTKIRKKTVSNEWIHTYLPPLPKGKTSWTNVANISVIKNDINSAISSIKIANSFSKEQGLCMSLRYLNSIQNKLQNDQKSVIAIFTDEDEHYGNNTTRCPRYGVSKTENGSRKDVPFKTAIGQKDMILSWIEYAQKASPNWKTSIELNTFISLNDFQGCVSNKEGETYRKLAQAFISSGGKAHIGNVCDSKYADQFRSSILSGLSEEIKSEYTFVPGGVRIENLKVEIKNSTGRTWYLDPSEFSYDPKLKLLKLPKAVILRLGLQGSEILRLRFRRFLI